MHRVYGRAPAAGKPWPWGAGGSISVGAPREECPWLDTCSLSDGQHGSLSCAAMSHPRKVLALGVLACVAGCVTTPPADLILTGGKIVTLNKPAKGSRPRQFKLSNQLTSMLIPLIHKTKSEDRIWSAKANSVRSIYCRKRKKLAEKLGNERLLRITLHTFRHWKATVEYHRTKDILYVKQLLGHRSLKNTLIYTHLVDFDQEDDYVVKVATSLEEYTSLLEQGFEYISDYDNAKVLRKRK